MLLRMRNGSSGTSTPTKIKEYADENSLSLVGEDIILPQNHRPPKSIGLSKMLQRMGRVVEAPTPTDVKGKTEEILLTIVGEDIILPKKYPPTEPCRSVGYVIINREVRVEINRKNTSPPQRHPKSVFLPQKRANFGDFSPLQPSVAKNSSQVGRLSMNFVVK